MVTSMVAPMIAAYGLNGCLQTDIYLLCRVGSVGSVSASRTVGREFASQTGHTKDHHKNGTNCLPA